MVLNETYTTCLLPSQTKKNDPRHTLPVSILTGASCALFIAAIRVPPIWAEFIISVLLLPTCSFSHVQVKQQTVGMRTLVNVFYLSTSILKWWFCKKNGSIFSLLV